MAGRTTLKALAEELGLNVSTVSRVLNDPNATDRPWASGETRTKILNLAAERGYRKNPMAKSLRTAKSDMVGVVVPRIQDYVLATMYGGIEEAAAEAGYFTVVANSLDRRDQHSGRAEELLDRRADGLIFGDAFTDDDYLTEVARRGVPFALINRRSGSHPSVSCDDYAGGRLAAEHLVDIGCSSFAVIGGDPRFSTSIDRNAGFLGALADHDASVPSQNVVVSNSDAGAGREAASSLLKHGKLPDAIFVYNDFTALGAYGVLREAGVRIGHDVALVGFNDTPMAESIGMTSIRSPMHKIGREGFRMLLDVMNDRAVDELRLEPELVVRSSSLTG